ncbi:MAG: ASCH domain-containing protein [Treponema sp.]|nr:ASCH domain-containing protein [Treponema sp.]
MLVKTLSVRQPFASLICHGVKAVENRTWKTDYRGRLLIHASGDEMAMHGLKSMPESFAEKVIFYENVDYDTYLRDAPSSVRNLFRMNNDVWKFYGIDKDDPREITDWIKPAMKACGCFYQAAAIIGEADLVDIVRDSADDFAEPDCYHWILANPKIYEKPVTNVLGKLRLWDFDLDPDLV